MSDKASDHQVMIDGNGVQFSCAATHAAACRLGCALECEDYHRSECDRSVKDVGNCGALTYFDAADPFDTYIGATEPNNWQSGPIDVEWDSYYDSWLWRFPGEDRQLPGSARYRDAV
ncbi:MULTISPECIES: hypothetical protein [unclassified Mycolicibacterium]|uniref:Uncharacterized protein n=2 Tax=Mycolicibacterium sp. CBMA 213 TaxID=1968788 RepID=A0A343VR83_9MYCO|nr:MULTISPECIES: hypothetical protein [unclassified Mycolicibacterium]AVN58407.1 hypothetical protein B5P44_p00112 [Mycolicibacterium sp. CBMA 213]MUL61066.1 hypothetical protein [Mycolicibacterium sp. CBMA 335]